MTAGWSESWITYSASFAALSLRFGSGASRLRFAKLDLSGASALSQTKIGSLVTGSSSSTNSKKSEGEDGEDEDDDSAAAASSSGSSGGGGGADTTARGNLTRLLTRYDLPNPSSLTATGGDRIPTFVLFHRSSTGQVKELGRYPSLSASASTRNSWLAKTQVSDRILIKYFSLAQRSTGEIVSDRETLAIGAREEQLSSSATNNKKNKSRR